MEEKMEQKAALKGKVVTKDPELKLAYNRLSVIELAETLGNITKACRQMGMDRNSFYEWKRRFQTQGLEGLKDLPPIHKSHPQTTPEHVVEKIKKLTEKHPSKGCGYLSHLLNLEGHYVSKVTVQEILNRNGLGSRYDRWLALERKASSEGLKLSSEQVKWIEKMNPCFRERHVESKKAGELLCQDTFLVGTLKGIGKLYLQAVIDTHGSFAFGYLHTGKVPEHAAYVLYRDVIPFYKKHKIPIGSILTDNGKEYCGTENHPYEVFLELNDIEHRKTKVRRPQSNGFVERFNRTALDEFFRIALRKKVYRKVEELQKDLNEWLNHYNYERPHQGYRNMGKRPAETLGVIKCK
jgi:transposase InsO family protein